MGVRTLDHVGVVVDDLEASIAFFVDLGLEPDDAGTVEGEWVDKVVGLDGVRAEVVFVRAPDGNGTLELVKYHSPSDADGPRPSAANRLGIRHVSFVVDDLDALVDGLRRKGFDTVGEVQDYKQSFRLCYVRGPEGIIVELVERRL